jgi:hypothetical protein
MIYLRQSTASQEVILGPFVDSTDGNTQKTALTIANTDIKIWVNGATTLANKNSGGATHISGGIYYAVLDATDTATIGPLVIFVHVATALAVRVACMVLDEAVYDAWFGTVALATATNITAGTITTVTTLTNDPTGVGTLLTRMGTPANLGSGATVAANLSDIEGFADDIPNLPTAAAIADAVWDEDATAHQTQGTFGQAIGDPAADTNTIYGAVVTGAAGATVAADVIAVKTVVDDILVDTGTTLQGELDGIQADTEDIQAKIGTPSDLGSGATVAANLVDIDAGGGGGLDAAGVRAAIGLASANLDTQLAAIDDAVDTEVGAINTNVSTLVTRLGTPSDLGSGATVADNLVDIDAGGGGLDAAGVRAAIGLASANLDTQLADLPTNAELAAALAAADDATLAAIAALNDLSAADVRTAVGLASANLDTQLGDLPTNAELAAALATADDAVLAAIAALNNLSQANVRTALGMASANLDTQLADLPTNAELATALGTADDAVLAAIAALNDLSAAQVGTEVDTALDTTIADSVPADGTRPSVRQALYMLTQFLMEKEVAGTTVTVNKPDATTALMTFTLDDAANPTTITRTT